MLFSGLTLLMATLVAKLPDAVVPVVVPYATVATHGLDAIGRQGEETQG